MTNHAPVTGEQNPNSESSYLSATAVYKQQHST